jgi:cell division protein FtsZ
MVEAFSMADEVLLHGVSGITDLINVPGLINTDFADVKMVMSNAGSAIMGIGTGSGEGRAVNAARHAITSPLLEASIEGARGILLNIAGGSDLTLFEVNEAAAIIHDAAHPDANIIFGNVIDDALGDTVRVTVIAAGFDQLDKAEAEHKAPAAGAHAAAHGSSSHLGPKAEASPGGQDDLLTPRPEVSSVRDVFDVGGDDDLDLDDDFDVPSFLR